MRSRTLPTLVAVVGIVLAGQRPSFARAQNQGDAGGIYVVDADGAGSAPVFVGPGWFPAWSPDGTRIAFASIGGLAVIGVDGSDLAVLLADDGFDVRDPAWSPDGARIAFGGAPWDAEFDPSWDTYGDLHVVNADGTELVKVAATPLMDLQPAWSPDGTRIAFASEPPGN